MASSQHNAAKAGGTPRGGDDDVGRIPTTEQRSRPNDEDTDETRMKKA
jgi:hypothetical protein